MVHLSNATADTAVVSLYGAQVLSWCTAAGGEQLYCSPQKMLPGRAVRGGVPVCFPQFGNYGPLTKHGFARTSTWQLLGAPVTGAHTTVASASFGLQDSPVTQALWPFGFALVLHVQLGAGYIEWRLRVANTCANAFSFTAALHTYLATADVQQITINGLANVPYLDALRQNAKATSYAPALRIMGEVDRVYLGAPATLALANDGHPHLRVEQTGFADTVVWNPGPNKAASLGDMPAADWQRMLCIEAAQMGQPVQLLPGLQWLGSQRLTTLPLHAQNKDH